MSDPSQHSFTKLKRLVGYLKGEAMDPSVRVREHELRSIAVTWVLQRKPAIDAKATEYTLHRHGIGKMKHIDVAHFVVAR